MGTQFKVNKIFEKSKQKMKIFATLAAFALAQDGPDGRAMSLNKKIENAQNKCSVYMSKAYSCAPPSEKIGKYTFRLDKVLLDAKHHLKVGKCDVGGGYGGGNYRRKRETQEELEAEFDAVMAEINSNEGGFQGKNYGSSASQGQLTKLEGLCEKFINAVFNDDSLADCPKLGAWKNRSSAIFEDLVLMKNVCIKQAQEGDNSGGGGGGYNGGNNGGNNNNNNNNNGGYNGGNNNNNNNNNNSGGYGGNSKPETPAPKPETQAPSGYGGGNNNGGGGGGGGYKNKNKKNKNKN